MRIGELVGNNREKQGDMSRIKRGSNKKRFQVSGFGCQGTEVLSPDLPPAETLTPDTAEILPHTLTSTINCRYDVAKRLILFLHDTSGSFPQNGRQPSVDCRNEDDCSFPESG
jgi:hypothetical protein